VVGSSSAQNTTHGHVYSDQHHAVAVCGPLIATYSTDTPNPRFLLAWDQAASRLAAEVETPILVLIIIDGRAPTPDEPSRKAIRHTIGKHKDQIGAFAYVIEGRGFAAAAMRSAVSLMSLAARYPFPQKVFANTTQAAEWLAHLQGGSNDVVRVLSAVEGMRNEPRVAAAG
jgi:hypothetical protein